MKINIENVLQFFDNTPERGHASSIVGILGEDLNAAVFKDFMERERGAKVEILSGQVTTGHKKGKRLDRWIYVKENKKEILYQCEIKSWSATAIGGKYLSKDVASVDLHEVAKHHWLNQLKTHFSDINFPNGVTKVLVDKMNPPEKYKGIKIEPLIIYWMPICKSKVMSPFFRSSVSKLKNKSIKTSFREFNIFSVSLYLRELQQKIPSRKLDVIMPNVENRLKILKDLIVT